MESQHRRELNFRLNASQTPAADAPWHATAFPHPQPVPSESSHPRLDPLQLHGCTGVVQDNSFPKMYDAGNHYQDEAMEDILPPTGNIVARGQPQDPRYDDMGYYGMAYDDPPPHGHRDHSVADYAGDTQDDPTEAQVNPPAYNINTFNDAGQHATAGPAQSLFGGPIPNGPPAEYPQRIAIHYLHQPNLQVSLVHMEPSHAGGVKVVITLEMTGF